MTYGGFGPSTEETKRMIKKLNKWADDLAKNPDEARKFFIKHGFITKSGKLTKRYGG